MSLNADKLFKDPQYLEAKRNLLETILKYQAQLNGIESAKSELKQSYDESLKKLNECRGIPLFYPYLGSGLGKGALVELADGSIKYDFISGVGVHFGHSHPKLIEAGIEAAIQDIPMQGNLQQNREALELSELLLQTSGIDHCLLTTSGAMANENALKLILQKKHPANRILAFEKCFIGRTLALSQITDKPAFREGLPAFLPVDYIPFYDWKNPKESTDKAVSVLKRALSRYPGQHACMCFELILGEGGNYPGKQEFFLELMKILKEHQIAIFVDEVQTFGRTEHLFAFQNFGLQDYVDIVSVGKLLQVCAVLYNESLKPKPGLLSQTFISSTSSLHCGLAILKTILNENFLGKEGRNLALRKHFVDRLQQIADRHPDCFEGPFGYGLMIAATPFKGDKEKVTTYVKALFEAGVIAFIAGDHPTRVRFLIPPGGVTLEDIDRVSTILEATLVQFK